MIAYAPVIRTRVVRPRDSASHPTRRLKLDMARLRLIMRVSQSPSVGWVKRTSSRQVT